MTTTPSIDVHSPANGSVVGRVPERSAEDVGTVAGELRERQHSWEALGVAGRVAWLERYRDWLLDNEDRLARVLQSETGKPWAEATIELPYVADLINYYCAHAESFLAPETPPAHGPLTLTKRQRLVRRPYPVVGVITPWNFPLALALVDAIPALLAGAAVVVKPSEYTPLVTSEVASGWSEIGAPDVFTCVTGAGEAGAAVVDAVDYVQFTGSTRTGRAIGKRAAERLIPYSLELGGKDAMIVLADADLDRAARGVAWGGLCNAGQMCTSVERVYVDAEVHDEFVRRVVDAVGELRVGEDDQSYRADVGALANADQLDIVTRHVTDAVERGASVLTGGNRVGSGTFFEPTVLVDVDHDMACMREETFGPTIPIMRVTGADEAVRLANDTAYGLSASVWTRDTERGRRVAERLEAGAVNINDVFANLFTLPLPQAGWKQSGIGARLGGAQGIRKYTRSQAVVTARVAPRAEPQWYPYSPLKGRIVRRLTRLLTARDLRRRLRPRS
ncbi:betaine-aldehyde dehydrogenase [Haloechinothrix alba]|uniref:Aldehyde dehydrogenase n=1 Tax=Haloechinothrix alba TaxID=664784 RepID=A0A238VSV1_9PSEU|nr:aldehyde dehydrogenase family protein [Haloechinothrix alba]SNR37234.1 betaine-aldehyde dehydrogenase [Haloechinothrix alba]